MHTPKENPVEKRFRAPVLNVTIPHGGQGSIIKPNDLNDDKNDEEDQVDDIGGLLYERFKDVEQEEYEVNEGLNEDAKKFYNLVEEAKQELYPGCNNFSKLSFTIRLYLLKCLYGWSNASFNALLELLREAIPQLNIPDTFNKTKCMIRDLRLDYKKIDACPKDCMLYWKDHENDTYCQVCSVSRWNENPERGYQVEENNKVHKVSAKVLRHFPLIPRLKRLFMCSKTASSLRWHEEERWNDGKLRHPADGEAWKDFDQRHLDFAIDSRNVRLGLASDIFNLFKTMNVSHSTWSVVLIPHNFPPWWCMKAEYSMLSLLIPGPYSPGNDIGVYLQPLIEELKVLWDSGLETYDASVNQTIQMQAALLWTISDFPRSNARDFNGRKEDRPPPDLLEGEDILDLLHNFINMFGKMQKKRSDGPWKKKSIFLSYHIGNTILLRHNLDVMHIFDNIIGTLLDIPGKKKDHEKARFDLQDMGIRKKLHPKETDQGKKIMLAKTCFSMTANEKTTFCGVLKKEKLPDDCASNISRCVQLVERKLICYKSHDAHFMLHYLL